MINMISMFSKIKNHALVTGYQNSSKQQQTNAQTATTNTASTSNPDQSSSKTETKSSKTPATLNSISSNINSLQNACVSNYSNNDNLGTGQQANPYQGRSGVNVSKVNIFFIFNFFLFISR